MPGAHSPVGASSAKRFLTCPAAVALAAGIADEESEHAALGTAVHALIEHSFRTDTDAWMYVGLAVSDGLIGSAEAGDIPLDHAVPISGGMAVAAQVFLDAVRKAHPVRNQGNFGVERHFHCPSIHPLFFGTTDVWYLDLDPAFQAPGTLHIWDYKNGAGVVVEVEQNEQGMYYAAGILEELQLWDKVDKVVIHIAQPNGFHGDGPVRAWETSADDLAAWLEDVLVPGMDLATSGQGGTASGEQCRFCPARSHGCPQLLADMEELQTMVDTIQATGADPLTHEQVGRFLTLLEVAKIVGKAANTTAFNRMQAGQKIPGFKLVKGKANRAWKDGAEADAKQAFGAQAYSTPELKSPAEIDKLPLGEAFTARWAAKPDVGLTVARASDPRAEVSVDTKSLFTDVTKTNVVAMRARRATAAA